MLFRSGFAPSLKSNEEAFDVIMNAILAAGFQPGEDIVLAIDVAASEMYKDGIYQMYKSGGASKTAEEMVAWYASMCDQYPLFSIEDGMGSMIGPAGQCSPRHYQAKVCN